MSEPTKWTEGELLFMKELKRSRKECDTYKNVFGVTFVISVILIAKAPILGGLLVVASFFSFHHFSGRDFECKQSQEKLLASKGIQPDDFWIHGVK
jgi:hypothetical protein